MHVPRQLSTTRLVKQLRKETELKQKTGLNKTIAGNRSTISTASQKPSNGSSNEQPPTLIEFNDAAPLGMDFTIHVSD